MRRVGAVIGMSVAFAACDRQTVDAAAQPYEVVTQMRPESPDTYMRLFRKGYEVCALARTAMKLPPPPPLVTLPADFVMKRSTYLGSGPDYLIRHEEFYVDIAEMTPEAGCKSRLGSALYESMGRGGKIYAQRRERDGHLEVDEPTPLLTDPSKGASDEGAYTEKRTVGGLALRCLPAALRGGLALDKCAAVTDTGLLHDGARDPIVLRAREFVPVFDMVVLTEPVSVQIGKPVNQERIALSKAK